MDFIDWTGRVEFKADFQSVLRRLGVCLRFCFEFVETLHFGDSIHDVFYSAITVRFVQEFPMSWNVGLKYRQGSFTRYYLFCKDIWR